MLPQADPVTRRAPSSCIMRLVEERGRPAPSVDLETHGAWQVDATKLGASADIFFNVALEAPIIIWLETDLLRCAALQNREKMSGLKCLYSSCWLFSPNRQLFSNPPGPPTDIAFCTHVKHLSRQKYG